ncbi:MAG TPA: hypothetical protein VFM93_02555 [Candidatus Limnocylindria bacterium]|nr:hypothetical protein [Candidatus Limnocylindria bacterium]
MFDGEGSTLLKRDRRRPGYSQLSASVGQRGETVPELITRFQAAVLGMGEVERPGASGVWQWRARSPEEAQAVISLLWRWLGPVKRSQAAAAVRDWSGQYARGLRGRRPRSRIRPVFHPATDAPAAAEAEDRAWAAGFLDGEGSFCLVRAATRKWSADWRRVRVSASQNGAVGAPADVLVRLQRSLGVGRIERHGEPDDFRWCAEGRARVVHVLELVTPWLGSVKVAQAAAALSRFDAQERRKGEGGTCVRGHSYDRVAKRGDRIRKICNSCRRLYGRRERARRGVPPRKFKRREST